VKTTRQQLAARAGLVGLLVAAVLLGLPAAAAVAEPLRPGAGYADRAEASDVRSLQQRLRALGWDTGPADGRFGPRTQTAVLGFQAAAGVQVDGIVGPRTRAALRRAERNPLSRGAGYTRPDGSPKVRALQRQLRESGHRPGPVDGLYGPLTEAAVSRFQRASGTEASGIATPETRRALARLAAEPRKERAQTEPRKDRGERAQTEPRKDRGERAQTEPRKDRGERAQTEPGADRDRRATTDPAAGDARRAAAAGAMRAAARVPGRTGPVVDPLGEVAQVADRVAVGADEPGMPSLWLVLGGAAALLGLGAAVAAFVPVRSAVAANVPVLVDGRVVAEGRARDGRFRGRVHAVMVQGGGLLRPRKARFLIRDPDRPGLFWADRDEVASMVDTAAPPPLGGERAEAGVRAIGYVTTREGEPLKHRQLREQMTAIDELCARRRWELVEIVRDVESPHVDGLERPGLAYAVGRLERGDASCLIVAQLGRLSRDADRLARTLDRVANSHGRLVVMDLDIDTAGRTGRVAAEALIAVTGWERERLVERARGEPAPKR
jgi:peptidoglycan hydrolase-like protein with peptidoglycan-binding domain